MSEDTQTVEADTALGKFKISSANLNTLFTVLGFVMLCLVAWVLWQHNSDAADTRKDSAKNSAAIAQELKEANKEVAVTLKESNKEVAKVLTELSRQIRIQNCISAIPPTVTKEQRVLLIDSCRVNQ